MAFKFNVGDTITTITHVASNKLKIQAQKNDAIRGDYYLVTHENGYVQEFDAASLDQTATLIEAAPKKTK